MGDAAAVEAEIVESCRRVEELTGESQVPFAFPFDADGVDRAFLRSLRERNPVVGLRFGADGIASDEPFLLNRMIADAPPRWGRGGTNLPSYLRRRYLEALLAPRGAAA